MLVTLKSAKDLPAADSNGLSDPYALLTLAGRTKKSTIIYDSLSPEWNEKFEFIKVCTALYFASAQGINMRLQLPRRHASIGSGISYHKTKV